MIGRYGRIRERNLTNSWAEEPGPLRKLPGAVTDRSTATDQAPAIYGEIRAAFLCQSVLTNAASGLFTFVDILDGYTLSEFPAILNLHVVFILRGTAGGTNVEFVCDYPTKGVSYSMARCTKSESRISQI